jgi:DNA-directed RNA polymerase subunit RPC12/RpoP
MKIEEIECIKCGHIMGVDKLELGEEIDCQHCGVSLAVQVVVTYEPEN